LHHRSILIQWVLCIVLNYLTPEAEVAVTSEVELVISEGAAAEALAVNSGEEVAVTFTLEDDTTAEVGAEGNFEVMAVALNVTTSQLQLRVPRLAYQLPH